MILAFLNGMLLGFSLVTPLGPQNSFILSRSNLQSTYWGTLPLVATAIICDGLLILLGTFGVQLLIPPFIVHYFLLPGGALFLLYFGIRIWKTADPSSLAPHIASMSLYKQVLFLITLSILNPHALIDTIMVIGAASAEYLGPFKRAFAIGCLTSDTTWFFFLSICGFYLNRLKHGIAIIKYINRLSSIIMIGIALELLRTMYRLTFG